MFNPGNWTTDGVTVLSDYPTPGTVVCTCASRQDAALIVCAPELYERVLARTNRSDSSSESEKLLKRAESGTPAGTVPRAGG